MTDTTDTTRPHNGGTLPQTLEELAHTSDWYSGPDTILQQMADFADAAKAGINVTLIVPGGMITGAVESAQDYFAAIAESLRTSVAQHGDDDKTKAADAFARSFFDNTAKRIDEQVEKDRVAFDKGEIPTPRWPMARYIHLANAHFTAPGQYAFELGHTRVLLSQVVGWTSGERRLHAYVESQNG